VANEKKLKISAGIDLTGFDADIQKIQTKMKQLQSSMDAAYSHQQTSAKLGSIGLGTPQTPQAKAEYERFSQKQKRDMEALLKEQINANEKLKRLIDDRRKIESDLNKDLDKRIKGSREYLDLEQKIARQKENTFRLEQQYIRSNQSISGAVGSMGGGRGRGPVGGADSGTPIPPFIKAGMGMMGIGMGVAGIASLIKSTVMTSITDEQYRLRASGSATRGLAGRHIDDIAGSNIFDIYGYAGMESQAREISSRSKIRHGLTSPSWWLGGGDRGRDYDSLSGRFKTGITDVTGLIGTLLGAVTGIDFKQRADAVMSEGYAGDVVSNLESLKASDPNRIAAINYQKQNLIQNLGFQRAVGMSDQGLYGAGGFLSSANQAGFTGNLAMEQSAAILAAGGSTRAAKGGAISALQAGRGYDQTNAAQVLAKLSSTGGADYDSTYWRMLSESVSKGLDTSETRKYMEITADVIAASGAITGTDQERIRSSFGGAMSGLENSMAGQRAALSTYQQIQAKQAETTGRGAAIQYSTMRSDPDLGKLSPGIMGALLRLNPDHMSEGHGDVIAAAAELGISESEVIEKVRKAKGKSMRTAGFLSDSQTELLKKAGSKIYDSKYLQENPELLAASKQLSLARQYATGGKTLTQQESMAVDNQLLGLTSNSATQTLDRSAGQGRAGDTAIAGMGVAAEAMLENFMKFKDQISPTVTALDDLIKAQMMYAAAIANTTDAVQKAKITESYEKNYQDLLKKHAGFQTQQMGVKGKAQ
jgi:hypothetical protein